jgi:hypothetical protein
MSDPFVESYPCQTCDLAMTLRLVQGGSFYWACQNDHWWKLDAAIGWRAIDKPEGV